MPRKCVRPTLDRLFFVPVVFGVLFLLVEFRLFYIQVVHASKYRNIAKSQYRDISEIPSKRGDILSSDGYPLASTQLTYLVFAEPHRIANKPEVARRLAEFMSERDLTEDESLAESYKRHYEFYLTALSNGKYWVALERSIPPGVKEQLEALKLEGLGYDEVPIRYYPEPGLLAHVLGYVAYDEQGEKRGYFGIEGKLNDDLKGRPGKLSQELDAKGVPILIGNYSKIEPLPGRNVILTINRSVQYLVEQMLKAGVEKYDAASGSVIVMDPLTSEIIAMANYPSYDPSDILLESTEEDEELVHRKPYEQKNLAISQTYEPGSVIKGLTISAAVDLNSVTPETTFEDAGPVSYSGYVINNWDGKHYGTQTIVQLLQKSNNIGAAWVGHRVGAKNLYEYFSSFGLGRLTNIELEGEDTGLLRSPGDWTDIDLATAAFGQGVSATVLQVLNAFNVIANGGYLFEPKIIAKIVDGSKEIDLPTRFVRRVISKEAAETMVMLLEKAAEGGEAQFYILKNYRIAGKTGTAQIPVGGKYDPQKTNATFVGFLAGSRKLAMIVKLEEPRSSIYAAETAVPLWMQIASELVSFYSIPPDKN